MRTVDNEGLKVKYNVHKVSDGEVVNNCFVLRPDKDPAAVAALTAYAKATDNKQLAEDIFTWITPDEKVVVLPCKVGTPIWWIDVSIEPNDHGKWITRKRLKARAFDFSVLDWIDTPFYLTREAAEAALAKEAQRK